jgi:retron-type reverse transcriptase
MSVRVNPQLVRLALASIQPASADAVNQFIQSALGDEDKVIALDSIRYLIHGWEDAGDIVCVHKRLRLYSLTKQGDSKLSKAEKRLRDRTRLFLLKEVRASRLERPEAGSTEKADVSSAVLIDPAIQEGERPIGAAAPPRQARSAGRAYWPLLSKQLFVGSSSQASGPRFRFLSFPSVKACARACGFDDVPTEGIGSAEIALGLGVSPRLIGALLHKPERHYRSFEIPKANGKPRLIRAPRTMMKMVQYFLLDYILRSLPVHPAATAYGKGCSNRANAEVHVGKQYVANIDVTDFFPSLTTKTVFSRLCSSGLGLNTAHAVARLCSYQGSLPQGAPTSAALSNIVLFDFDKALTAFAEANGVEYTRYADDITFSGKDVTLVRDAIGFAGQQLEILGLRINESKTRIFGPSTRQVVTGVVVNVWPQPSRLQRRRLRATLHHAALRPDEFAEQFYELQGRAAYMLSFAREGRPIGALSRDYVNQAIGALRGYLQSQQA